MGGGKDLSCDAGCCSRRVPQGTDLQDMIQEFRTIMKTPQTDPNDLESLKLLMNVFIDKFEAFFDACGFTFNDEGEPTVPEVMVANQQGMMDNMVSMVFILIDWCLAYGWDFNKEFKKAHTKVQAQLAIQSMGLDPKTVEVVEPAELNNTVGEQDD